MLGFGTRKAKKRHTLAFYIIGIFTFAIEFMLGVNAAFLIDQSIRIVAANMLSDTPLAPLSAIITLIASLGIGFCFVFGGMWTFSGFMDSLHNATSYKETYGTNWWPVVMVWALEICVIALDLTTLLFRAAYFAEKGALALFAFFLILIILPPVLGPLVHVLEHTPRERRLTQARQYAEELEADGLARVVEEMDDDLRSRWLSDDATALTEHYERKEAERQQAENYQQQKIQERQDKKRRHLRPLPSAARNQAS